MKDLGRVDVLVNNAGVGTAVPASKESPDEFRKVLDVNLNGCYWMAQRAAAVMEPGARSSTSRACSGYHRRPAAGRLLREQGGPDRAHARPRRAVDRAQGDPRRRLAPAGSSRR